MDQNQ